MGNEKLGLFNIIGSVSGIIAILFTLVFTLGVVNTKVNYLWDTDIPTKLAALEVRASNLEDFTSELKKSNITGVLIDLQRKIDDLWEYRKTRTDLFEKAFVDFAREYPSNPLEFVYTESFLLKMKSDDIKEILDLRGASHEDKLFTIINKIGGLEKLKQLMYEDDSLEAIGGLILFIEQYH